MEAVKKHIQPLLWSFIKRINFMRFLNIYILKKKKACLLLVLSFHSTQTKENETTTTTKHKATTTQAVLQVQKCQSP